MNLEKAERLDLAVKEWFRTSDNQQGIVNSYWTIRKLSELHSVSRSTLQNHVKALVDNKNIQPIGRPKLFSDSLKETVKLIAQNRDVSKNSFTNKTFKTELENLRKKEIISNGGNEYSIEQYSNSSYWRLRKEVLPEQITCRTSQNQRRYEALIDLRNHISLAVMWPAILSHEAQLESPAHLYNFDATTILLEMVSMFKRD
jgi:hypothetical protein